MDDTLYFYIVYDCFRGVKKQVMIKTNTNTFISSGLLEIKIKYIENRKFKRWKGGWSNGQNKLQNCLLISNTIE